MDLLELTKKELEKGFTKSELERLWLLPKNSLSAILNPYLSAKFSKKAKVRVEAYFETPEENRPKPTLKISKGRPKGSKNKGKMIVGIDPHKDGSTNTTVVTVSKKDEHTGEPVAIYHSRVDNTEQFDAEVEKIKEFYGSEVNKEETTKQENTESSEFDFSQDRFLIIENYTKYPLKERPKEKGAAIEWDKLKKEYDNKIRQAWAVYKEKGGSK